MGIEPERVIGETMTQWMHIGAVVFCIALAACTGDKAKELFETAELEERQHNVVHAKQLYEDIIRLYPSSPQAETARARLILLNNTP
jgi:chloramphenicol 3-O-phosphotransferase